MPMEDIDKNEVSDDGISDEEELLHREVIQGDADLYYLHHYLSEVFRNGDNFEGVICYGKVLREAPFILGDTARLRISFLIGRL